jgi:probable F420-dependent oxidoreductase
MTKSPIAINLQLDDNVALYADEARAAERDGFAMVTAADHPGTCASPSVVLGALAMVTSTLRLGAYVANAGTHEPLDLASDIATIDQLSEGRAVLGLGAGHTAAEWTMYGRPHPTAGARVDRLVELVDVTTRLLAGETVTFDGAHIRTVEAKLETPLPIAEHVPVLIGGGGRRVMKLAGRVADIVSYSGLGKTLPDGHRHEVLWSDDDIRRALERVTLAASEAGRTAPTFDILVQLNMVTDSRDVVLEKFASRADVPIDVLRQTPFLLVGTLEQQAEQIERNYETWGITSYTVRDRAAGAELIAALNR